MIEIRDLRKQFGDVVAIDDLSLEVLRGELFVLLGPNAAGKTTTMKIAVGLLKPTRGTVRVAGFDVQLESLEARRRLAYVPDFPFLYEKLTPAEFLRFIADVFRMDAAHRASAEGDLVKRFDLGPFLNRPIETLSQGTRQRLALASAFLHEPEVLIIDEPMVGLDPHHARVVKDALRERARAGASVFLSTHQLGVAEELADRIGIMHRGRLVAVGSPAELRALSGTTGALENVFLAITEGERNAELSEEQRASHVEC